LLKQDLRRATILVVASIIITLILALLTSNYQPNLDKKSSFLANIENQKQEYKNIETVEKENRVDIKVLNLDDFGSVKSRD